MPVEVERDQGEVSVKVDIENATENTPEIVVPTTKEHVGNGISHGGSNGNGNDKEDTDGSYVFITENDTVGDDSAESDPLKPFDANVEKDLEEGENLKVEARATPNDVLGVSQDSQTLEKSEEERAIDGPEEVVGIPKSEIEDLPEKGVEQQHPVNGHLETGHDGELESTEEVEQGQDSEVGPGDLPKNNVEDPAHLQEKLEGNIESGSKTDVEGHQGYRIEAQEKSDLGVVASEDLQHNEGVAKLPADSDEGRESELVSAKVSPIDPNDVDMGLGQPTLTDPDDTIKGSESVNDPTGSESVNDLTGSEPESVAVLESVPVENGHPLLESELEKIGDVPFTSEAEKVNASNDDVLPDSGTVEVSVSEVSSDVPAESQTLTSVSLDSQTSGKDGVVENGDSKVESEAIQDFDFIENSKVQSEIEAVDVSLSDESMNTHQESQDASEPACDQDGKQHIASEDAQSVKDSTETHVARAIEDSEINREVNCGSEVNVTKTTPFDVCEDTPSEEVSEMEESDIKERSAINTDEEVDSNTKSSGSTKSPLVNNDIVTVSEEGSIKEKNETSGATASVASETKTGAHGPESKVVTSTDTIHTGAKDCVDSQPAENEGGNKLIENEIRLRTSPVEDEKAGVDCISNLWCSGDAVRTDDKVASTCEIGETQKDLASASSAEGSALDASEGQTVAAEIEKRPFYFLPRVPRYDDEKLAELLKHADAQVDQKTQSRDALRADIQKIRATCKDYDISYKAAMAEERSARKAMHSKRQEIEALQSVISRVKNAASVDDIDLRVHNMEHMIQHETLSLSEEKGFIREIKQLKQLRGQISSSMGTKDEVKQALDEKDKTEERLKVLRKELDVLRSDLSKAEAVAKAAKKKCEEEWEVLSKLQEQFRAADAVRQEAFVHLQDLKKQQREKNKYFFKYRDDSRAANEMALKKDRAALQSLCSDQV
ncbi:hypothetical protein EUTSA_v10006715mg [Eutrema salsugineum]|uniref:Uncharacterized protein n=1 Tax=Eutrema salsugineum TaxID=72664 RepID=V4MSB2_EUTSA|nr:hypothetical protein EUTSA_v10006715mg [Eutrema salsugineum]